MSKEKLNRLRRMAGAPVDYSPDKKKKVTEDVIPGMGQVLRGGKHKFYLVTEAKKKSASSCGPRDRIPAPPHWAMVSTRITPGTTG